LTKAKEYLDDVLVWLLGGGLSPSQVAARNNSTARAHPNSSRTTTRGGSTTTKATTFAPRMNAKAKPATSPPAAISPTPHYDSRLPLRNLRDAKPPKTNDGIQPRLSHPSAPHFTTDADGHRRPPYSPSRRLKLRVGTTTPFTNYHPDTSLPPVIAAHSIISTATLHCRLGSLTGPRRLPSRQRPANCRRSLGRIVRLHNGGRRHEHDRNPTFRPS
jgi:hypothetical protein